MNRFGTAPFEFAMVQGYCFNAIFTQEIYLFYLLAGAKKTIVRSLFDIGNMKTRDLAIAFLVSMSRSHVNVETN